MEKVKKWQVSLIIFVMFLTIYNILPTIFYYTKPLGKTIDAKDATYIQKEIAFRVAEKQENALQVLRSFCRTLSIKPKSLEEDPDIPGKIRVVFYKEADASTFRDKWPLAKRSMQLNPASLHLRAPAKESFSNKECILERSFATNKNLEGYLTFSDKQRGIPKSSALYRNIVLDRLSTITSAIFAPFDQRQKITHILSLPEKQKKEEELIRLAQSLQEYQSIFGKNSPITKRYFTSLLSKENAPCIARLKSSFKALEDALDVKKKALSKEKKSLEKKQVNATLSFIKKSHNLLDMYQPKKPISCEDFVGNLLRKIRSDQSDIFHLSLGKTHPFIKEVVLDWKEEKIAFKLHEDVQAFINEKKGSSSTHLILEEISRIANISSEKISRDKEGFSITLYDIENSKSLLALDLWKIAEDELSLLKDGLLNWKVEHPELQQDAFPIFSTKSYINASYPEKRLGIVLVHPEKQETLFPFLQKPSLYVVAKGLGSLLEKYEGSEKSEGASDLLQDIQTMQRFFRSRGFVCFPAKMLTDDRNFSGDLIFEKPQYFHPFLRATEEAFSVRGSKRYAYLELKDVEHRILTQNQIDTAKHERLLQEKDAYHKAQTALYANEHSFHPAPTKSAFWSNMTLSATKYFRGDERKILRWGLDLSGGKTVTVSLHDPKGEKVTDPLELDKGMSELEKRVNRLGVSEVQIRKEADHIVIDFPGSQNFSAEELIKGSSMFFHIANEKFSYRNPELREDVFSFLEAVWNEASIHGKTHPEEIQEIACKHLYGDASDPEKALPKSAAANTLFAKGLRLAVPGKTSSQSDYDETFSKIAVYRKDAAKQDGYPPLLIAFHNYALKGAHLTKIAPSYDPVQGNFLRFAVQGSHTNEKGKSIDPKGALHAWTKRFCRDSVVGSPLEKYTGGEGFRMCVLLNDELISAPKLEAAIRDQAMISGNFSQKEVAALAFDLKAGSLSYTPKIVSETNVSPELGAKEKFQGIIAMVSALALVMVFMSGYYGFAGIIASFALILNLLIMWASLQSIGAALTLPGIAGIILTLGMAVDANVIVFERIKEELTKNVSLKRALFSGYEKAYSAIFDANITTVIAGIILFNFDAGPIKAFAITLIIGTLSSLFSALFVTRVFFNWWLERSRKCQLFTKRSFYKPSFAFLTKAKYLFLLSTTLIISGGGAALLQKQSLLGLEFQGGYSLTVELTPKETVSYRKEVRTALIKAGMHPSAIQIRELNQPNHLRILLGSSLEEKTRSIANVAKNAYPFEKNPSIRWIIEALQADDLSIKEESLAHLHESFSSVSAQFSSHVKTQALIGLLLAFVGIFCYLTLRFEFSYAAAAILCLLHDVLVSLGAISLLRFFGMPLQLDLHAVAALMTIIGYSLNDTIIVFDRMREDLLRTEKASFSDLIEQAINGTLSRTLMTSLTTLLSLSTLVCFGGAAIFNFSFIMAMGVLFGTASSLFLAGPFLLLFSPKKGVIKKTIKEA